MNNKELKELQKILEEIKNAFFKTLEKNVTKMVGSEIFDVDRAIMKFEKWIEEHSQD